MINASIVIGDGSQASIDGYTIELKTPAGTLQVGIDNNGQTYISSGTDVLVLKPRSANRVNIELSDF